MSSVHYQSPESEGDRMNNSKDMETKNLRMDFPNHVTDTDIPPPDDPPFLSPLGPWNWKGRSPSLSWEETGTSFEQHTRSNCVPIPHYNSRPSLSQQGGLGSAGRIIDPSFIWEDMCGITKCGFWNWLGLYWLMDITPGDIIGALFLNTAPWPTYSHWCHARVNTGAALNESRLLLSLMEIGSFINHQPVSSTVGCWTLVGFNGLHP